MSSRKAVYESSILCDLGPDVVAISGLAADVRTEGLETEAIAGGCDFGFALGAAVSLLTRTDAGTCFNTHQEIRWTSSININNTVGS